MTALHPTRAAQLTGMVRDAYDDEIELLDGHDLAGWAQWLEPDFRYEVPIPLVRDDHSRPQYSTTGFLAVETRPSVQLWVERLSERLVDVAFAENPPVRHRHFLSAVRVRQTDDPSVLDVRSNVLLTWTRAGAAPDLMTGERHDRLVLRDDRLFLRRRRVLLDSVVVHLSHLRVIF